MAGIDIRPASANDAPAIAKVRVDSWRTTYRGLIPDAYLDAMQVDASTAMWERVLSAEGTTASVFVATHGGAVIGFSAANALQEPKHGADAEITAVYLRREYQHAGIGRQLLAAVVEAQQRHGATAMIVWVIAGNKVARAFCEGLGGELVIEQPFQWDGMDLIEAGYVFRDLPALAAATAPAAPAPSTLQ